MLVTLALIGCGRSGSSSAPPPPPPPPTTDAAVAATAPVDAAPVATAPVVDAGPADAAGAAGAFCQSDAECGWDDQCMPGRCVAARAAGGGAGCDESAPPPGTCSCVENQCALRRNDPSAGASTAAGCTRDDQCAIDVASATCHLGGTTLIGPIHAEGPVCTCGKAGRCEWSWSGPVACKSWRDCSWVHQPRLRPVPAKLVPRPVKRPVRACKDGEVDSVCTKAGTCEIVAWSC